MKKRGLGSRPKETAEWKIRTLMLLTVIFGVHIMVVYVCEWFKILTSADWGQMLQNYYSFMDRADALFERWM